MSTLAALALATPIFGFALAPPTASPVMDLSVSGGLLAQVALEAELDADASTDGDEEAAQESGDKSDELSKDEYREQLRERNSLIKLHKPLGIATWAAMTATVALGVIQYYNLYGFFDDQGSNPCVTGSAVFGQSQCTGTPWPHALGAGVTTGLYAATFTVSLMMPDPDDLASGKGEFASTLRLHKLLRWIHFGGMVAQSILGVVIATDIAGLDRANDYDTLQTLATIHLASGLVTWGAMTYAGALMVF